MARGNAFDRKFGLEFVTTLPSQPGVYRMYDEKGSLVYVGKAKNLRRRLGQYRNAKRFKKHEKMRMIVKSADRIEYEVCPSELEAVLLEARLIQENRPRWNVAGAFYFLYPLIGFERKEGIARFCYTTSPEIWSGWNFHGAFRSRSITGDAFFSLMELFSYLGHREPTRARVEGSYSYRYEFRQLSPEWDPLLERFFMGKDKQFLEALILALVENAAARKRATAIQASLVELARFWKHEARKLYQARIRAQHEEYPVAQRERDLLFLRVSYESCDSTSQSCERPS